MQTYAPFTNWNNTFTPFAQNFGGFNPWFCTPGFTSPQNWNSFPGFQNWSGNWNTTPWWNANTFGGNFQNWNRPMNTTWTPWNWNYQPWNTFNTTENFQPWGNWTPAWNTPFNTNWFQPTTNWFNTPFGYNPVANYPQPFTGPMNQSSYPFANYAGGNYPFTQGMPTNAPVYPSVGHPCREAA